MGALEREAGEAIKLIIRYAGLLLLLALPVYGAVYLNGTQIDADVRITTNQTQPPEPPTQPPVEPPDPPSTDCPPSSVPIKGTINLDSPGAQRIIRPSPWLAYKITVGSDTVGQFSFGSYQGNDGQQKNAAITVCPIVSNDYLVSGCYAYGSSSVNLPYGPARRCTLKSRQTYYLMYGNAGCGSTNCQSVFRIY